VPRESPPRISPKKSRLAWIVGPYSDPIVRADNALAKGYHDKRLLPGFSWNATPAEILERCGLEVLYHPMFWHQVHNLAALVKNPCSLESNWADEIANVEGVRKASTELRRLGSALGNLSRMPRPKRRLASVRTLQTYEAKRRHGWSEKRSVLWIAFEQGRSPAAVRLALTRARKALGEGKRHRRRGPTGSHFRESKKRLARSVPESPGRS
jgi:hypothetical protein